jgi:hypothetical protein
LFSTIGGGGGGTGPGVAAERGLTTMLFATLGAGHSDPVHSRSVCFGFGDQLALPAAVDPGVNGAPGVCSYKVEKIGTVGNVGTAILEEPEETDKLLDSQRDFLVILAGTAGGVIIFPGIGGVGGRVDRTCGGSGVALSIPELLPGSPSVCGVLGAAFAIGALDEEDDEDDFPATVPVASLP